MNNKLIDELLETFRVKRNSVVSFFFVPSYKVSEGFTEIPEGYQLYRTKVLKSDNVLWRCYIKPEMKGVFAKSYWSIEA